MARIALAVAAVLLMGAGPSAVSAAESCPLCQYLPAEWGGPKKTAHQAGKRRGAIQRAHARKQAEKLETAKIEVKPAQSSAAAKVEPLTTATVVPVKDTDHQLAEVGCMNFFPTVGRSLPVPCDQ